MNEIESIKMEAISLGTGESVSVPCFFCGTKERKLSITRTDEGILYNCYRAGCSGKGFIGSLRSSFTVCANQNTFKPKKLSLRTKSLTKETKDNIYGRFQIEAETLLFNHITETEWTWSLVIPIYTRDGVLIGHTTKHLVNPTNGCPKALHYKEKDVPMLHWPKYTVIGQRGSGRVVLVEDALSAMRINQLKSVWRGVALLGTNLSDDKVEVLMKAGVKNIIIALDPDATDKAHKYAKELSFFFKTFRVAVMSADPKDLSPAKLREELDI